ncbi:MAG TPA: hypothetical protein PL110_17775 [Candidatus Eremiobacteraeota bacterium]|mgnify:CR=1 FL=1|nr:hypothetical protein [Candidatus Eremiobacteraeota bacterium]
MAKKRATFNIDEVLLEQAKGIAKENYKSLNKFIEQAIKKAIYIEQQRIYEQEMKEAAKDELYLQDIKEIANDFARLDVESLECIE